MGFATVGGFGMTPLLPFILCRFAAYLFAMSE